MVTVIDLLDGFGLGNNAFRELRNAIMRCILVRSEKYVPGKRTQTLLPSPSQENFYVFRIAVGAIVVYDTMG